MLCRISPKCLTVGTAATLVGAPLALGAAGFGAGGAGGGVPAGFGAGGAVLLFGGGVPAGGVLAGLQPALGALSAIGCTTLEEDDYEEGDEDRDN